jgi:hypothetical protein
MLGCAPESSGVFDAEVRDATGFAEFGMVRDGSMIRADARAPLPDAVVLNDAGEICRSGGVTGVACAPDGTGIVDAIVEAATTDCDGNPVIRRTRTDARGRFELGDLAVGPTTVTIRSGNFRTQFESTILAGTTVPAGDAISDKVCLESDAARLGVLTGAYDRIQNILGSLGFGFELICGDRRDHRHAREVLNDAPLGRAFDVLFINCASGINFRDDAPEVDAIKDNLRAFVAGGGSLYVSDLSADIIEQLWPDAVDFTLRARAPQPVDECCVCVQCSIDCIEPNPTSCDPENQLPQSCAEGAGIAGNGQRGTVRATVVPQFLRDALGSDTFEVVFNLGGWMQMAAVGAEVEVLVAAPDGSPLMVLFEPIPGGGRVAYTSFHTHAQANAQMEAILAALALRL